MPHKKQKSPRNKSAEEPDRGEKKKDKVKNTAKKAILLSTCHRKIK
jgi:hypothetical protein